MIMSTPDLASWEKYFMCEFWKNKEGNHPEINTLIHAKDIINKVWIPEDNISVIIMKFLEYQESLPKEERQFWFPPFKIQIPLDPYDLNPELKKEEQNKYYSKILEILKNRNGVLNGNK